MCMEFGNTLIDSHTPEDAEGKAGVRAVCMSREVQSGPLCHPWLTFGFC